MRDAQVVEVDTHADVAVRRPTHFVQDTEQRDVVTRDILAKCIRARRRRLAERQSPVADEEADESVPCPARESSGMLTFGVRRSWAT